MSVGSNPASRAMKHSQNIGKRERLERAAKRSFKNWKDKRRLELLKRLQERDRLQREGIPTCANCHCVEVVREGLYCWNCAEGMH
jgi:hypothetical protein